MKIRYDHLKKPDYSDLTINEGTITYSVSNPRWQNSFDHNPSASSSNDTKTKATTIID